MRLKLTLSMFFIVISVGCGDNVPGAVDAAATPDAPVVVVIDAAVQPDAPPVCQAGPDAGTNPDAATGTGLCTAPAAGEIGAACAMDSECVSLTPGFPAVCVTAALPGPIRWPPEGFCSQICASDADCGPDAFCGSLTAEPDPPMPFACMPRCCAGATVGDECSPGRICTDNMLGNIPLGGNACMPGNYAATDGDPCVGFYDCNLYSNCVDDPFEAPGGVCQRQNCTVGDDTTCAPGSDGRCIQPDPMRLSFCVDTCDTCAQDCRTEEAYACADDAEVGAPVCGHPKVGDECTLATDCGDPTAWACFSGDAFPGGYCTISGCAVGSLSTCSRTSTCHDPDATPKSGDEFCATQCDPMDPASCRAGYTCVADAGADSMMNPVPGCLPMMQ